MLLSRLFGLSHNSLLAWRFWRRTLDLGLLPERLALRLRRAIWIHWPRRRLNRLLPRRRWLIHGRTRSLLLTESAIYGWVGSLGLGLIHRRRWSRLLPEASIHGGTRRLSLRLPEPGPIHRSIGSRLIRIHRPEPTSSRRWTSG